MISEAKYFIGIDLGGRNKKTTGVCILRQNKTILLKDIFGKDLLKVIGPYLNDTKVIAIDAPLTGGSGKGKMRLYEKFLSTKFFRQQKLTPIPPALMPQLCNFAGDLVKKLEKRNFVLGLNFIEVFPTLMEKMLNWNLVFEEIGISSKPRFQTENQKSAFLCAILAFLHSNFKTRYLGYKDGFLFLAEMSLWKKSWREKFLKAWQTKPFLKYRHLVTNLFN